MKTKRVLLFGAQAHRLERLVAGHEQLVLVDEEPDVVVSYGGDGTLLAAEWSFPGLPKVPILNSKRGHRCIPHPADEVIGALAADALTSNTYTKLLCQVFKGGAAQPSQAITALNEVNVHMGRINSAVRFQLWLDGEAYEDGLEILGDGFIICTPFGSSAYFTKITRGAFVQGIGIAFKATSEPTDHIVLTEDSETRVRITRGPAVLGFDSATEYIAMDSGDEIVVSRHEQGATILTCDPVKRLDEPF